MRDWLNLCGLSPREVLWRIVERVREVGIDSIVGVAPEAMVDRLASDYVELLRATPAPVAVKGRVLEVRPRKGTARVDFGRSVTAWIRVPDGTRAGDEITVAPAGAKGDAK